MVLLHTVGAPHFNAPEPPSTGRYPLAPDRPGREFESGDIASAELFIRSLPDDVTRVYVDEWDGREWRFVYGDAREHVLRAIRRLVKGERFRIRAV